MWLRREMGGERERWETANVALLNRVHQGGDEVEITGWLIVSIREI